MIKLLSILTLLATISGCGNTKNTNDLELGACYQVGLFYTNYIKVLEVYKHNTYKIYNTRSKKTTIEKLDKYSATRVDCVLYENNLPKCSKD